jgi:hypothetical protein
MKPEALAISQECLVNQNASSFGINPAVLVRDPCSKERPMNRGIIRDALTTTLALELGYREPSFREIGTESERLTEPQHPARLFEDEFTRLLTGVEKVARSGE